MCVGHFHFLPRRRPEEVLSGIVILGRSARACVAMPSSEGGSSCPTIAEKLSPPNRVPGGSAAATATAAADADAGGRPEAGGGIGGVPEAGGGIDCASSLSVKEKEDCRSGGSRWNSFDLRSHSSLWLRGVQRRGEGEGHGENANNREQNRGRRRGVR